MQREVGLPFMSDGPAIMSKVPVRAF
jgi:hypothetical protein